MRFFENMPDDLLKEIIKYCSTLEKLKLGLVDKRFRKLALAMIPKLTQAEKDKLSKEIIIDLAHIECQQHLANWSNKPLSNLSDDLITRIKTSLALGADVNVTDECMYGKDAADLSSENALLHKAVIINSPDLAKILIKKGANINYQNSAGHTPLHYTVFYKNPLIARIFVEHKADSHLGDFENKTPSQYARERDLLDFAVALETNSGWENLVTKTPSLMK